MIRFSRLHVLALAALTVAVACMTADAQPPGGGRGQGRGQSGGRGPGGFGRGGPGMPGQFGRGGGVMGLLQIREVRDELKISDEQIGKLTRLREDQDAARRDRGGFDFQGLRDLSDSEREARMREFQQEREKQSKATEEKVREILTGEQFKRLKQIELQQQGTAALMRPDIGQALGITDDQRAKMREASEGVRDKMRGLFENVRDMSEDERAGLRDKMGKIRADSEKALMAVLTDDQKAKLKEVMGKPFDLPRPEFGRGGPGGGRGGPGAGGDRGGRGGGDRGGRPGGDRGGEQRRRRPQA